MSSEWVFAFALVAARVAGVFTFAPFFSDLSVPFRTRAGMVALVTAVIHPLGEIQTRTANASQCAMWVLQSAVIGLLLGLSITLVFEAVRFAGQIAGIQVGLSLVTVMDPQTQADTPVLATFLNTMLLLLFLALNVHHWLLRAVVESFSLFPPQASPISGNVLELAVHGIGSMFLLGVEIATPVLAVTLVTDVALAFLGKASPQMPVLMVGLPIKLVLGLLSLSAAIRYWPVFFDRQFAAAIHMGHQWLAAAR